MAIESYSPISSNLYSPTIDRVNSSLASGSKINQSADNPAGQAIVNNLTAQINTQDMAVQNVNDGISLLQTASAGAQNINENILRMNELATQAQNGTLNSQQRNILNLEFQQNLENINGLANTTSFNGQNLLNGESSSIDIALGETANTLSLANLTTDSLGLTGLDISDPSNASLAMQGIQLASEQLLNTQSQFGSQQNGLTVSAQNISNQSVNTLSSRSQISDTDFARALTEQARQNILNESSIAMQAQSNQTKGSVLQLLGS